MRGPIREEIETRFSWLLDELGFRIVEGYYAPRAMGSSSVVLESDSLRVRFVNDRGAVYPEVASLTDPQRWIALGFLWSVLTGDRPTPELDGWAWFLREHIGELTEALGPRMTETAEAVLRRERENQEAVRGHRPSWETTFVGIPTRFYRGPLGWILAAVLLFWTLVK
jgi:hypothetical protein